MGEVYEVAELVIVGLVVVGAVVFLGLHWSGTLAKLRARKRPDVKVSALVRKKDAPRPPDDDCCR